MERWFFPELVVKQSGQDEPLRIYQGAEADRDQAALRIDGLAQTLFFKPQGDV